MLALTLNQPLANPRPATRRHAQALDRTHHLLTVLYCTALGTLVLAIGVLAVAHGMHLLKSSGVVPNSGEIAGLSTFVNKIMNSVKWFAATLAGLSAAVICAMFISGHQSAHSHAIRMGFGVIGLMCLGGLIS